MAGCVSEVWSRTGACALGVLALVLWMGEGSVMAQTPEVPRIDSVAPLRPQPAQRDPAVIWYDDFDDLASPARYGEKSGELVDTEHLGDRGMSLRMYYATGERGTGNRKVFFGDAPTYPEKVVRRGEKFTDVYWRVYVKHQRGWTGGGPAKMSRATSMTSANWQQAVIAHVWSGAEGLTLDPASGVQGDQVVTRRYNDFSRLHWLGNSPGSKFLIHSTEQAGRWVCVEARAKLNTPGKSDGYTALWIDGIFQTERKNLNWRESYDGHGINAVFLEAYWNRGSPVDQSRYMDEFVISTKPIGPVTVPLDPTLIKTPYFGPAKQNAWEIELAVRLEKEEPGAVRISESTDLNRAGGRQYGNPIVGEDVWGTVAWKSRPIAGEGLSVVVNAANGSFVGPLVGKTSLTPGSEYFCRVRQQGDGKWSEWSEWHQPFQTVAAAK